MHIEINAGGLGAGIAVAEYQLNMSGFISDAEDMIASFKAVTGRVCELSGGVGSLQDPLEELEARIALEEQRLQTARDVRKKSNNFLDLAIRVDRQVADLVEVNQEEFYRVNPWLRPPEPEEKAWYEEAWDWLCGVGEAVKEGLEEFVDWAGETLKNAWDGLVEFYNEHKKIIDTILLVVGAIGAIAAVIATGGLALAPLLGALGVSASVAAAVSTAVAVVAVVSTVAATTLNVADVWLEIDNPIFNAVQSGLNVISTVTNLAYSVGNLYNSFKGIDPKNLVNSVDDLDAQGVPKSSSGKAPAKQQNLSNVDDGAQPVKRTWQGTEDNVDGFLGDDYHKQISVRKDDMTTGHYGEKGTIRLDDVKGEIGGKPVNLAEMDDVTSIEHFDVAEAKNYAIEKASGRSNLKKNIIGQATERNEVLSQAGASVNQTYYIDTVGHDITVGQWERLYNSLMDQLPGNVDIFPMWK